MDQLGNAIEIAIVFFILSLISERFITWCKLYFFKKGNTLCWIFFNWKEDYSEKSQDPVIEKEREQRILLLNITLSILIATIIHANLFGLLSKDPMGSLGWTKIIKGHQIDWKMLKGFWFEVFGCIFAGLLMSLGSKFWHDTLDMLFYTKNLKDKLVDKETYKMNTLKELDQWIAITESDMLKKVFEENLTILKNIANVISVGIGQDDCSKYIEVITTGNDTSGIPKSLPYYLPNNAVKRIGVKVVVSNPIRTHGLSFTNGLTNQNRPDNYGSYGLAVKFKGDDSSSPMLLTCYHVVIGKHHSFNYFKYLQEESIIIPGKPDSIVGSVRNGVRNDTIDAAILDVNDAFKISNKLPDDTEIKSSRTVTENDKNLSVRIFGYKTKGTKAAGTISAVNNDVKINYESPDGTRTEEWNLSGLISISNKDKAISIPGDSGSAVVDKDNNVIGIVVAGNSNYTFAIPIETIFKQLNIELI